MAGKRSATSDLNHDNWNQDEEPEDRGSFQRASDEALKARVIKTARRRNPIRSEDTDRKSAFMGFTGFSNKPVSTDFSFLKSVSKSSDSEPKTNGIDKDTAKSNASLNIFTNTSKSSANIFDGTAVTAGSNIFGATAPITSTSKTTVPSSSSGNKKSEKFCSKLKGLNESVSKWIVKKVEENPLISLQPIFKDYDKYLGEIEREELNTPSPDQLMSGEATKPTPSFNFMPTADKNTKALPDSTSEKSVHKKAETTTPSFKVGASTTGVSTSGPTFSFASATTVSGTKLFSSSSTSSTITVTPTFSFGSNNSSSGSLTFPTSTGLSFGGATKSDTDKPKEGGEDNENDEDEPPKVEFKPVVEKDHVYTIRCKVFVKKGDNFGDRGVGNLYLKPIEKSEKLQLIVRADTNLGNLLLNFILSESVPTKRMGKKDVMLVAVPTPEVQPPPTPILLRVKTPEDADKLLEVLEKHKK